jgi:hypothetical protein
VLVLRVPQVDVLVRVLLQAGRQAMSSCKGLHCPGCSSGGGWGVLAVIVVVLLTGAAVARPVEHAAIDVLHVLEIAGYCLAGLIAAAGAGYAALRLRRHRLDAPRRSVALPAAPEPARAVGARTQPAAAIEAPAPQELHLHVHGLRAEDLAAMMTGELGRRDGPAGL